MGKLCVETARFPEAFAHFLGALAIFAEIGSPERLKAANDLRKLREAWGAEEFDKAWREKTGQEVPQWLRQEPDEPKEEAGQAGD